MLFQLRRHHRDRAVDLNESKKEWGRQRSDRRRRLHLRLCKGAAFRGACGQTDVSRIVDRYMHKKIQIGPMMKHRLKLERINKGFDLMHEVESIRSVAVY